MPRAITCRLIQDAASLILCSRVEFGNLKQPHHALHLLRNSPNRPTPPSRCCNRHTRVHDGFTEHDTVVSSTEEASNASSRSQETRHKTMLITTLSLTFLSWRYFFAGFFSGDAIVCCELLQKVEVGTRHQGLGSCPVVSSAQG